MKLVVFAHVPPPFHGQSFMVQQLLDELCGEGGDGIEVFHVDARLSRDIDDIASASPRKLFLLLRFCLRAIWLRISRGATHFYYVPAPGLRNAVYRDLIVMLFCRPFYRKIVYHYQAAGLGGWGAVWRIIRACLSAGGRSRATWAFGPTTAPYCG